MSMAQLVAAGAPELSPRYFYRVSPTSIRLLKVEIRRQGRWFSTPVSEAYVRHEEHATAEAALVDACVRAFESWKAKVGDRVAYNAVSEFVGDHDPKGGRK